MIIETAKGNWISVYYPLCPDSAIHFFKFTDQNRYLKQNGGFQITLKRMQYQQILTNVSLLKRSVNLESKFQSFHLNQKMNENIFVEQ